MRSNARALTSGGVTCACSEGRIMCERKRRWKQKSVLMWRCGGGGGGGGGLVVMVELSAKWVFTQGEDNVKHTSTRRQHNASEPLPSTCVFRGSTVNYLSRSHPLSLRPDIQPACASARGVCAPECHAVMRMDMTVTGPSTSGRRGAASPFYLFIYLFICRTHTHTCNRALSKTVGCNRAKTITKLYLPDLIPSYGPKVITFKLQNWGTLTNGCGNLGPPGARQLVFKWKWRYFAIVHCNIVVLWFKAFFFFPLSFFLRAPDKSEGHRQCLPGPLWQTTAQSEDNSSLILTLSEESVTPSPSERQTRRCRHHCCHRRRRSAT